MGTLLLANREEIGNKLCVRSINEKIVGENEKVCVKTNGYAFLCVQEIDHPSNISMKSTVEQLAPGECRREKNCSKNLDGARK